MSHSPYELILFDVDHTLLDFDASEAIALNLCWQSYFCEAVDLETYTEVFKSINLSIWHEVEKGKLKPARVGEERARRCLRHFGFAGGKASELGELFAEGLASVAQWLPGAESVFRSVARDFKVGLVTNGLVRVQRPRVAALQIEDSLVTYQISEEVGVHKPHARIFQCAMEAAGSSPEQTLMVGDSVSADFQGAINSGIDFCWVRPESATLPLGFPKPKFEVESIRELPSLLGMGG